MSLLDYCVLRSCISLSLSTTPSGLGSHIQRLGIPAKIKLGFSVTCMGRHQEGAWGGGSIRMEWTRQIDNTRFQSARNNAGACFEG